MFQVVWFLKFCKIIFLSKENRIEVSLFFKFVLKFQSCVYFEAKNIINLKWREIKEFSRGFIGNLIVFMIKIHRRHLKLELWAPFFREPSDKCRSSLGPFSARFVLREICPELNKSGSISTSIYNNFTWSLSFSEPIVYCTRLYRAMAIYWTYFRSRCLWNHVCISAYSLSYQKMVLVARKSA